MTDAELMQEITRRVVEALSPQRLILFGSRARGDSRPDSDVDLLVVWKDESPPRERALAVRKVLRGLKASFDIAVVTPSEFARFAERRAHVVGLAAREGRVLHAA